MAKKSKDSFGMGGKHNAAQGSNPPKMHGMLRSPKQKGPHYGAATKADGGKVPQRGKSDGLGSNLKFKNTSQAIHVMNQPDKLAHNVGGSASHMQVDKKSMGFQNVWESGDGLKRPKAKKEPY